MAIISAYPRAPPSRVVTDLLTPCGGERTKGANGGHLGGWGYLGVGEWGSSNWGFLGRDVHKWENRKNEQNRGTRMFGSEGEAMKIGKYNLLLKIFGRIGRMW